MCVLLTVPCSTGHDHRHDKAPRPPPPGQARTSHPGFTGKGALNPGRAAELALVQAGWPVLCPLSAEAGATVAATSR